MADIRTIIIAASAFGLSLASFMWQVIRSRYERPIIQVSASVIGLTLSRAQSIDHIYATDPERRQIPAVLIRWKFQILVANVGDRAATIENVGWWYRVDPGAVAKYAKGDTARGESGPRPPVRLEANDSRVWTFEEVTVPYPEEVMGQAFAVVVQRPTWWEKLRKVGPRREIKSELSSMMQRTIMDAPPDEP